MKVERLHKDYIWKDKKILIVEDEEINYLFFEAVLSRCKSKILWADNGQKAVDIVNNEENIDLILMDIRLPVMDGCEATRRIKEFHPEIPIIAQTAYAMEHDRERIFNAGCDDYLTKPIHFTELLSTIDKYFCQFTQQVH